MDVRKLILIGSAAAAIAFLVLAPPIAQPPEYHSFADQRPMLGLPNFWNVVSNLPFAVVGALGLLRMKDPASRVLFAGVLLTSAGSAYYHFQPNDATLVWDRLPMTLVFMALLSMVLGQWVSEPWERLSLKPLVAAGIASVLWWERTGDLRPYLLAQFGPLLIVLPALFMVEPVRGLWPAVLLYALAKLAESFDPQIYKALVLSGHTWKHFLAALATWYILRWRSGRPSAPAPSGRGSETG